MSVAATEPARRVRDAKRVTLVTTPGPDGHTHCATIDPEGNGITSAAKDGHWHRIAELDIVSAFGHGHDVSTRRCLERHNAAGNHIVGRP